MLNVNLDPNSDILLSPDPYPDLRTKFREKNYRWPKNVYPKLQILSETFNNDFQAQEGDSKSKKF